MGLRPGPQVLRQGANGLRPHFEAVRKHFQTITDRWVEVYARPLNVHGELDLIARLARPRVQGHTRVAGIKLDNLRLMRLLEVLIQKAAGNLRTWNTASLHRVLLDQFRLKPSAYTLNQLRYDLRKLRLHGLLERLPHTYHYRLTASGQKAALLIILFRRRIYGPLAYGLLHHRPNQQDSPDSTFERAYFRVEKAVDELFTLIAA